MLLKHIQYRVGLSSSALDRVHLTSSTCDPDHRTSTVSEQLRSRVRSLNQSIDPTLAPSRKRSVIPCAGLSCSRIPSLVSQPPLLLSGISPPIRPSTVPALESHQISAAPQRAVDTPCVTRGWRDLGERHFIFVRAYIGRAHRASTQHACSACAQVEGQCCGQRVKGVHLCQRSVWDNEAMLRSNGSPRECCGVPVETGAH